jgi:hypothetical protein
MTESSGPMNEMELLRELAQETPLPAPGELDAARARLVAAITTDPATYATAVAQVTADQPSPPVGGPADPLRPPAPAPVRAAARFMYGGAVCSAVVYLVAALPFIGDIHGKVLGHRLTPTPLTITLVVLAFLALVGLWVWMAWATSRGKGWARILSTVLFALATLEFLSDLGQIGKAGVGPVFFDVLTLLSGLGAVWMLWRPASSAFFTSAKAARSRPRSQISGP